jgi:hypothetical protein
MTGRYDAQCNLSALIELWVFERSSENMRKKRNLFSELMEGFDALADQRAGKRVLRTHTVKPRPAPKMT